MFRYFKNIPINKSNNCVLNTLNGYRLLSEKLFVRNKPHLIVGTIGHVDHGKTTLTAAITKLLSNNGNTKFRAYDQIDKAPEERSRGITIHSTMVEYETDDRHYGHIDCPGHIDYVKNMITGTAQMDGCILVVAATDGTMPQTKEHILLAKQIGIKDLVIYINKVDQMQEKEVLELVELEVTDLLNKYGYMNDPVFIHGSALKALKGDTSDIGLPSIERLLSAMQENIHEPARELDKPFLMSIEDCYTISGRGTVVTGAVIRGKLKKGEDVEIVGFKKNSPKVIVGGIQMFHKDLDRAQAGDSLGALLKGIKREDIHRGMVLAEPGTITPHSRFNSQVYILRKDEGGRHTPFVTKYSPQIFFRTANMAATLKLPDGVEMVAPGDDTQLQITLKSPMAIEQGLRFTLREGNRTIGTGVVTEIIE